MSQEQNTFWMLPREVLNADVSAHVEQRALITYNVLFGGPLIMSDSDLINNFYVRENCRKGFLHELIKEGYISVARRNINGVPCPLAKTAEVIRKKRGGLLKNVEQRTFEDLDFLETVTQFHNYELTEAQPRYETEVLKVFRQLISRDDLLPSSLSRVLIELIEDKDFRETITWSSFDPKSLIWDEIHKRTGERTLCDQFGERVFEIARGPYSTFIPGSLNVGATYSAEDQLGIDLWRGRLGLQKAEVDRVTIRGFTLGPAETVAGLALLKVSDIERLRSSKALSAYEEGCSSLRYERASLDVIKDAFLTYRSEVNSAIISAMKTRSVGESIEYDYVITEGSSPPLARANRLSDTLLRVGIFLEEEKTHFLAHHVGSSARTSLDSLSGGLLKHGLYVYGRVQTRRGESTALLQRAAQEIDRDKEQQKIMGALLELHSSTLGTRQLINETSRDLFTSVKS